MCVCVCVFVCVCVRVWERVCVCVHKTAIIENLQFMTDVNDDLDVY